MKRADYLLNAALWVQYREADPLKDLGIEAGIFWRHRAARIEERTLANAPTISDARHQLRLLRDRELISARREGRMVWYSIADDHVSMLLEVGLEHALHDCPKRKGRV